MGAPAVDLPKQSLVKVGFKPDQAEVLLRLMDLKMQNLLTQEYLDLALGRFADQMNKSISDLRTEVKQEIADLRTEVKDLKRALKDDIKDVRYEIGEKIGKIHVEIAERHNKQLLWMAGIIGMALAAARLLFSF
jgi:uncharacterized FlaG/YvyC family protein